MLIDAALKTLNGDASDTAAVRKAMETVDFKSIRGNFKFNTNHYPIQDILVSEVKKRPDGKYQTSVVETVYTNHADSYVGDCNMPK